MTDGNSKTQTATYDDAGRMLTLTNANGEIETYVPDYEGDVMCVKNGRNKTTHYHYTGRGEAYQINHPDGTKERFKFDKEGAATVRG